MSKKPVSLIVTAGDGPAECNQAVGHVLDHMQKEAMEACLDLTLHRNEGQKGPRSAVVVVHGVGAEAFGKNWIGTIQWRAQSQIRKHHKRANWFVGVFRIGVVARPDGEIAARDVVFSAMRAGGPGGQHQNTTDSAIRAVHTPTGLSVVVRDGRSQHQNKSTALERLQSLADARCFADRETAKLAQNKLHHALERGNPVRRFKGVAFKEER